jgi:hypothetical protein
MAGGAGHAFDLDRVGLVVVDLDRGYLIVNFVNEDCLPGVVAADEADLGILTYDITVFSYLIAGAITEATVRQTAAAAATSGMAVSERQP